MTIDPQRLTHVGFSPQQADELTRREYFYANEGYLALHLLANCARAAQFNNPRVNPVASGTDVPTAVNLGTWWQQNTAYTTNEIVVNFSGGGPADTSGTAFFYKCTVPGTSSNVGTGPSGTGSGIVDGGVTWNYVGSSQQNSNFFSYPAKNSFLWSGGTGRMSTGMIQMTGGIPQTDPGSSYCSVFSNFVNGNQPVTGCKRVRFMTDSQSIIIRAFLNPTPSLAGTNTGFRLIVNGKFVSASYTPLVRWFWTFLQIQFSSRAMRLIEFDGGGGPIGGIDVGITEGVYPLTDAPVPTLVWTGDSYAANGGASQQGLGFVDTMGDLLGVKNTVNSAIGGTGYLVNTASGPALSRIGDVYKHLAFFPNPILFDENGGNDVNFPWTTIRDASIAYMQAVRAQFPKVPIFSTMRAAGNSAGGTANNNLYLRTEKAKIAAVAAMNDPLIFYLSPYTGPAGSWMTGTGTDAAPAGDGNADIYVSSIQPDHPNDNGHQILYAPNMAAAVRTVLNQGGF